MMNSSLLYDYEMLRLVIILEFFYVPNIWYDWPQFMINAMEMEMHPIHASHVYWYLAFDTDSSINADDAIVARCSRLIHL